MSLKMACWEQPVARERFPHGLYQVSSCALEQPAVLNAAGVSVGTCCKTSTCHLWIPRGHHVPVCRLIYDILRGPLLSGNKCRISNFMHRHSRTVSHLQTLLPHEDEICFLLQKNKTSRACVRTPCKDCNYVFTREPKVAVMRHRGGPSQLKKQPDRGVNLSPMLMRSLEHSRGLNSNCKDEKEVCLGRKGKALWSSLEALNISLQNPCMLAGEKDGNNS